MKAKSLDKSSVHFLLNSGCLFDQVFKGTVFERNAFDTANFPEIVAIVGKTLPGKYCQSEKKSESSYGK